MGSINAWTHTGGPSKQTSAEDVTHQAVSSYFIGPQCENLPFFRENLNVILDELEKARHEYFPEDGKFITSNIQNSKTFKESTAKMAAAVKKTASLLGSHSLPFWSPRYEGHMCTDIAMPALLGFFATMIYNPNNVALEAAPITTIAEMEVGKQLCDLFGYNVDEKDENLPLSWGHITCGGTIANLESIWAARNLKYYPLALKKAMTKELRFLASSFEVRTCIGKKKLFVDMSTWELLNLKSDTVLDLTDRLYKEYGISPAYLEGVMKEYNIQSTGKDVLEQEFGIKKPPQHMLASSRHYSWPKGAAVLGLGSDNSVSIQLDHAARVDLEDLEKKLQANLDNEQAVYAVVAIIGSTEEGAVDPLVEILSMRRRFQAKGLSFLVHADAAWGGYFCTMLPKDYYPGDIINVPQDVGVGDGFVPDAGLRAQTQEDLFALRYTDSITVDPHKAGYIQYPAGALCYRDERMRFLVTWTSPYLSRGSSASIGIFGIEGSKPGAAAMSTWLANTCIGLGPDGYGALMSEVTFTCSRLSAEWAAMSTPQDSFVVIPFNELPSEERKYASDEERSKAIEAEKQRIRDQVLAKSNAEVAADQDIMKLLRALGSDLNINAFALNWRYSDGTLNDDIEEANYLSTRVIEALSIDKPTDDPKQLPLVLTSTAFEHELYGNCAIHFQKRLGLESSLMDLIVMRNVVMSPFPTERNFINHLAGIFRKTVEENVEYCRLRNEDTASHHEFLMQGMETVYLIHYPMFYDAKHRRQLIVSLDLPVSVKKVYASIKQSSPEEALSFVTAEKITLSDHLRAGGELFGSIKSSHSGILIRNIRAKVNTLLKDRSLRSKYRDLTYPEGAPFYLYGSNKEMHIDHVLLKAPNIQMSAEAVQWGPPADAPTAPNVQLSAAAGRFAASLNLGLGSLPNKLPETELGKGMIAIATDIYEAAMQPFPTNDELKQSRVFFFRPGRTIQVAVFKDPHKADQPGPDLTDVKKLGNPLAKGSITLGEGLFVDGDGVNRDPFPRYEPVSAWKEEFDQIAQAMRKS